MTGKTFKNTNPATGELINVVRESTISDLDNAVKAARKAFASWRKVPPPKRGEILLRSMRILEEHKEKFALQMTEEMGKIQKETRGDVQEAIDTGFYYAGEGRRLFGRTTPSELPDKFAMSVRAPAGVCGLITPWNFPMAIPSWKIYPALLCGNTMILKPSSLTPNSAKNFVLALKEAGVPSGVVTLVYGEEMIGRAMVRHPGIDLISFTGSAAVGAEVAGVCGKLHKKCSLELGGKNAMMVMEDADLDLALDGALWGAFGTAGQRCTATSRIILHEDIFKEFSERLVGKAQALTVGDGRDPAVEMGPLVSAAQLRRVARYVEHGKHKDRAKLLCGGRILKEGALAKGFFHEPTVFSGTPNMKIAQEEIFGPVTVLLKVRSFEEGMKVMNGTSYGLSGSLYTRDIRRAMAAIRDMETGITYINAPTIGAEVHLPFGGVKHTGNGHREAGEAALDIFSEWKAVYIDYSGKLQKAQIDS
ncbi:MAG: aldehyde dehydrogenase [Elusimicrobia bacterium RIFCSPLOWO2_01_FULL_54_10]|nr:MAG: aldehyde dehydrogenase [Elusimicrobia bacterium RIFCSPLOWO2_01_FULL_54_10]